MFLNGLFNFLYHAVQKCWIKSHNAICFRQVKSMATEKRKLGLFGVSGVLVAMLIIAGFVFAGNFLQASGEGLLTVRVMDKPVELDHLWLKIDSVSVQDEEGNWVPLELVLTDRFDLLELQSVSTTLSENLLPAGTYSTIRIHVSEGDCFVVFAGDPEEVPLKVPSNVLKVSFEPELTILDGESTTVIVDLQPEDIDSIAVSNSTNLRPVIKAIVPQSPD